MDLSAGVVRYGLAVLVTAVAVLIAIILKSLVIYTPLSLFVLAVAISAWFGGRRPGILAIVLGTLAIAELFYVVSLTPPLAIPTLFFPLLEFIIISSTITALIDVLRSSRQRTAESLAGLNALYTASPVGLAFLDTDLCYRRVNKALADLQGIPPINDGWRPDGAGGALTQSSEIALVRHVLSSGEPILNQEFALETTKGWLDVLASFYPVRTADGRLLGAGAVILDITARKHAEETRDRIANELRLLVESAGEGIYQIDRHGLCTFINPAACRVLGYEPDDVLGKNLHRLIHYRRADGTPFPESDCPIYRVMTTGQGVRVDDDVFERRDGVSIPVEYSSFPILVRGNVEGAVVTFADVTDRKLAEEARDRLSREQAVRVATELERRRLQTIIEETPSGIIYVDAATMQITANRAAERIFGRPFTPEAGLAQYVGQVHYPNGQTYSFEDLTLSLALRGETIPRRDIVVVQPNGQQIPVQSSASPVRDARGQVIGAVAALEDVSAQRELERLREEWVSLIAHDLRQPVSVILGYADLLSRQTRTESPELQPRLGHIQTSAYQLDRLIADLLDVSRIESKRLALRCQEIDLVALVADSFERLTTITSGRPLRIEVKGSIPPVYADPARVDQVLTNIISNAVKYGTPGTEIVVSIGRVGECAYVAVTNRGPGISAEEMPRLFSRYYRTSSAEAGKVAGLGLGLYISKGLVEAHGGAMSVESVPGETTTFRFTLPLAGPPAAPASQ